MNTKRSTKQQLLEELESMRRRVTEWEAQDAERKQAEEMQRRQAEYLEALHETTLDLVKRLELNDLLENILRRATQLVGTPHGYLYLVEASLAELEMKVGVGMYTRFVGFRLKRGEGLSGQIWETGQPLAVYDYDSWPGHSPNFPYGVVRALVGVPLKSGDKVLGVIGLGHSEAGRTFGSAEIELLTRFAQLAAVALDNARLFADAQQRAERMSALSTIGQSLTPTLGLDQLCRLIFQQVSRALKVEAFYVALYDEQDNSFQIPFHYDEGEYLVPTVVPFGRGPTSYVIRTKAPYVVNHPGDTIQEGGSFFGNLERPSASAMHVPMPAGDHIIGVISVQSYQEQAYSPEDLQLLTVIAHQAAIGVENARLYAAQQRELAERKQAEELLRRRNRELTLLYQVGQALISTLDVDQVLVTLLKEVCRVMEVPSSSVWLVDPDTGGLVCRNAVGLQSELIRGWQLSPGEGLIGWVATHGESLIVADARTDTRHFNGVDKTTGVFVRSILSVPLGLRGKVIGVLNVVDTVANRFSQTDQTLLELLSTSAAIAVDNARLVGVLQQRAVELEARNEELDAFAHTVAHDLNNPLSNVIGYAETLELYYDEMLEHEREDSIQAISRSARKMSNIIDELLLLAGVRQTEAKRMPLDMADIVAEARSRLSDLIEEYQADIIVPDALAWPTAMGYAPWVEEIWVNYLSNAIKYGGHPPCIELGATPHREGMIRFWIHDNGQGLPPDARSRLFSPFTRLDQIRARGHGLGLSIVRRIVEKLGGQVGVESKGASGSGSTFYFTLPSIV